MKILWFANTPCIATDKLNTSFNGGSWLYSLNKVLSKNSDINLYVCFYWPLPIDPFQYKNTWFYPVTRKNGDTRIERIVSRILKKDSDNRELVELLKVIEKVKPDLIHVHGSEDNFGLIQKHTTVPVVISIQGILSPYAEKFYSGIPQNVSHHYESLWLKIKLITTNANFKSMVKRADRERSILKRAYFTIGRTDWDKMVIRLLSPKCQYFVGNEMLRDSFYENQWNKRQFKNPIQLVTTTSNGIYKGFETIVRTAQLLTTHNTLPFEWNVVGLTESSSVVKIIKKWLKIDFKSIHINLLGTKDEKELCEILINSDIYCQVSHIENSPNSLCEAMLVGMPIIATFAGGTFSLLTNKKEGLLVQEGEPYSYAGAIAELACDFELANEYAVNARERALLRHNRQHIVSELINIYKSIKEY